MNESYIVNDVDAHARLLSLYNATNSAGNVDQRISDFAETLPERQRNEYLKLQQELDNLKPVSQEFISALHDAYQQLSSLHTQESLRSYISTAATVNGVTSFSTGIPQEVNPTDFSLPEYLKVSIFTDALKLSGKAPLSNDDKAKIGKLIETIQKCEALVKDHDTKADNSRGYLKQWANGILQEMGIKNLKSERMYSIYTEIQELRANQTAPSENFKQDCQLLLFEILADWKRAAETDPKISSCFTLIAKALGNEDLDIDSVQKAILRRDISSEVIMNATFTAIRLDITIAKTPDYRDRLSICSNIAQWLDSAQNNPLKVLQKIKNSQEHQFGFSTELMADMNSALRSKKTEDVQVALKNVFRVILQDNNVVSLLSQSSKNALKVLNYDDLAEVCRAGIRVLNSIGAYSTVSNRSSTEIKARIDTIKDETNPASDNYKSSDFIYDTDLRVFLSKMPNSSSDIFSRDNSPKVIANMAQKAVEELPELKRSRSFSELLNISPRKKSPRNETADSFPKLQRAQTASDELKKSTTSRLSQKIEKMNIRRSTKRQQSKEKLAQSASEQENIQQKRASVKRPLSQVDTSANDDQKSAKRKTVTFKQEDTTQPSRRTVSDSVLLSSKTNESEQKITQITEVTEQSKKSESVSAELGREIVERKDDTIASTQTSTHTTEQIFEKVRNQLAAAQRILKNYGKSDTTITQPYMTAYIQGQQSIDELAGARQGLEELNRRNLDVTELQSFTSLALEFNRIKDNVAVTLHDAAIPHDVGTNLVQALSEVDYARPHSGAQDDIKELEEILRAAMVEIKQTTAELQKNIAQKNEEAVIVTPTKVNNTAITTEEKKSEAQLNPLVNALTEFSYAMNPNDTPQLFVRRQLDILLDDIEGSKIDQSGIYTRLLECLQDLKLGERSNNEHAVDLLEHLEKLHQEFGKPAELGNIINIIKSNEDSIAVYDRNIIYAKNFLSKLPNSDSNALLRSKVNTLISRLESIKIKPSLQDRQKDLQSAMDSFSKDVKKKFTAEIMSDLKKLKKEDANASVVKQAISTEEQKSTVEVPKQTVVQQAKEVTVSIGTPAAQEHAKPDESKVASEQHANVPWNIKLADETHEFSNIFSDHMDTNDKSQMEIYSVIQKLATDLYDAKISPDQARERFVIEIINPILNAKNTELTKNLNKPIENMSGQFDEAEKQFLETSAIVSSNVSKSRSADMPTLTTRKPDIDELPEVKEPVVPEPSAVPNSQEQQKPYESMASAVSEEEELFSDTQSPRSDESKDTSAKVSKPMTPGAPTQSIEAIAKLQALKRSWLQSKDLSTVTFVVLPSAVSTNETIAWINASGTMRQPTTNKNELYSFPNGAELEIIRGEKNKFIARGFTPEMLASFKSAISVIGPPKSIQISITSKSQHDLAVDKLGIKNKSIEHPYIGRLNSLPKFVGYFLNKAKSFFSGTNKSIGSETTRSERNEPILGNEGKQDFTKSTNRQTHHQDKKDIQLVEVPKRSVVTERKGTENTHQVAQTIQTPTTNNPKATATKVASQSNNTTGEPRRRTSSILKDFADRLMVTLTIEKQNDPKAISKKLTIYLQQTIGKQDGTKIDVSNSNGAYMSATIITKEHGPKKPLTIKVDDSGRVTIASIAPDANQRKVMLDIMNSATKPNNPKTVRVTVSSFEGREMVQKNKLIKLLETAGFNLKQPNQNQGRNFNM